MLLGLVILFSLCLLAFMALAFFLPEWLGITGKKAREVMQHQQGDSKESAGNGEQAPAPETTKNHQE